MSRGFIIGLSTTPPPRDMIPIGLEGTVEGSNVLVKTFCQTPTYVEFYMLRIVSLREIQQGSVLFPNSGTFLHGAMGTILVKSKQKSRLGIRLVIKSKSKKNQRFVSIWR